jgi:DNA polymerase-3 subunit delta
LSDHSKNNVASALKINPYFVEEYHVASRNFSMKKVSEIVSSLRDIDTKSKGVGVVNLTQSDLLKELITKIMV